MFRRVVLALDGSELARRAIPYIADLARDGTEAWILEAIAGPWSTGMHGPPVFAMRTVTAPAATAGEP